MRRRHESVFKPYCVVQDFARLIFVSSPIEGASFCKMSVAPLDILTCQHTTLRITTFVAEALPPPELNPMHMRVHVSLREVIQDSLRGLRQQTPAIIGVPSYEVRPPTCLYCAIFMPVRLHMPCSYVIVLGLRMCNRQHTSYDAALLRARGSRWSPDL